MIGIWRKNPPNVPDPEPVPVVDERARLVEHIEREPGFRVTTVDQLNWICPYTLTLVPAPFDLVTAACDFLLASKPWTSKKPLPVADILAVRWAHFFRERWEAEPRLHLHDSAGHWLNPWTGTWVKSPGSQPRDELIAQRARHLALLPQAQLGALMDAPQLEALRRKRGASEEAAPPALIPNPGVDSWRRPNAVGAEPTKAAPPGAGLGGARSATPASKGTETIDRSSLGNVTKARAVLDRMLPQLPSLPGMRMAVQYEPVQGIGGDFYDMLPTGDGRWLIVIGDVSGHGAEAALIVSSTLKALRLLAPATPDPIELLIKLNDTMRPDLPAGHFITMWIGVLDPDKRTLSHVCAGHHPALLLSLRRAATLTQVGQAGTAIGVISGALLRGRLTVGHLQLEPGDLLVQFTDGLFEVNNANGTEFGRLRAMGCFVANLEHAPDVLAARMVKEVKRFTGGGLDDDLTLLVLAVDP